MTNTPTGPAPFAHTRHALIDALAHALTEIDGLLPGTVLKRQMRCGKTDCACHADPPRLHGPYLQWTRAVHGKTVTRYLTAEQYARYQPWFDGARQIKALLAKLEITSTQALEAERDTAATRPSGPPTPARRRRTPTT